MSVSRTRLNAIQALAISLIVASSAISSGVMAKKMPYRPDLPSFTEPVSADLADTSAIRFQAIARPTRGYVIYLTGDGGCHGFDTYLVHSFAEAGMSGFVIPTNLYFSKARSPAETAQMLSRLISTLAILDKKSGDISLVGWSFGADVLPETVNNLPMASRSRVRVVGLLGLASKVPFHVTLAEAAGRATSEDRPIVPEVNKMSGLNVLCLMGEEEHQSACPKLDAKKVKVVTVPGNHGFNSDYKTVSQTVLTIAGYEH
jgi:type IV secretory pathway VirJ component